MTPLTRSEMKSIIMRRFVQHDVHTNEADKWVQDNPSWMTAASYNWADAMTLKMMAHFNVNS